MMRVLSLGAGDWLMSPGLLPFPVHVVSAGNLAEDILNPPASGYRSYTMQLPAHQAGGMIRRYCTSNYKTHEIEKKANALRKRGPVEQWLGISIDEADRMRTAIQPWMTLRYPLIERGMNRSDCRGWLFRKGYPQPPKSSCVFCPYRSPASFRDMRRDAPDDWELACRVDDAIRANFKLEAYVHRSLKPLRQAPLGSDQLDLFSNECSGVCGV